MALVMQFSFSLLWMLCFPGIPSTDPPIYTFCKLHLKIHSVINSIFEDLGYTAAIIASADTYEIQDPGNKVFEQLQ